MTIFPNKRRRMNFGRSALWTIAVLMAASAVIRFGVGPGQALAKEVAALRQEDQLAGQSSPCTTDEELSSLLDAVLAREKAVAAQEAELADRRQTLDLAEQQIRRNLTQLEEAELRLSQTIARAETASEDDLSRLTTVYENMKPKDAALLFQAMSPEFAAGFIGRMRPDAAAQVMTGLTPESAYSISVVLAGRNAHLPSK